MMARLGKLAALVCLIHLFTAGTASALPLLLNYSGTFSAGSTLDGVAFGSDTPFTFSAAFDSATDPEHVTGNGLGIFHAVVTFDIDGFGVFTSDPAAGVFVLLGDLDIDSNFLVGLVGPAVATGFLAEFSTATPAFDADVPTPSVISGFVGSSFGFPFAVPLSGGAGDLVIGGVASLGTMAQLAQVPEPSSLVLFSIGGIALIGSAWRRRKRLSVYDPVRESPHGPATGR